MATTVSTPVSTRPWRRALLWGAALVLVARLVALGLGLMLWETDQIPEGPDYATLSERNPDPVMGAISGWTYGNWQRHDTLSYLEIAEHGYERADEVIVFPPLYPIAIKVASPLTGGNLLLSALLVSTLATIAALAVLFRLTEDLVDEDAARWATLYQIVFPTGYILLAAYAEPLMLLLTVSAFYLARGERWGWTGVVSFLAALTRAQAAVLMVPLLVMVWRRYGRDWWRRTGAAWAVGSGPLGAVAFQAYLVASGLPTSDQVYRDQWFSVPAVPGYELWLAVQDFFGSTTIGRRLALILFVVAVLLTVIAFRKLPLEYGAYMAAMIVLIMFRHDQLGRPLLSFSRHALLLFPGFMALAATIRERPARLGLAYLSGAANFLLLTVFFMWGFSE